MFELYQIQVSSVTHINDCGGRVTIYVSQQKGDEIVPSRWKLTPQPMDPAEKLRLAAVQIGDVVTVRMEPVPGDLLCEGVFIDIETRPFSYTPTTCLCTSPLHSDGFGLYCRNVHCGATMAARVERLSQTQFFQTRYQYALHPKESKQIPVYVTGDLNTIVREYPFSILSDPQVWGNPDVPLAQALMSSHIGVVSMATFLVRDLFQEFIEHAYPKLDLRQSDYFAINDYYGALLEATQSRSPDDRNQDGLIFNTIWALGIQSLSPDVIWKMMLYEKVWSGGHDVLIPYAYLLAHPAVLAHETGIDPLEAQAIFSEFAARRHEMFDIFGSYSSKEGMADVFYR